MTQKNSEAGGERPLNERTRGPYAAGSRAHGMPNRTTTEAICGRKPRRYQWGDAPPLAQHRKGRAHGKRREKRCLAHGPKMTLRPPHGAGGVGNKKGAQAMAKGAETALNERFCKGRSPTYCPEAAC